MNRREKLQLAVGLYLVGSAFGHLWDIARTIADYDIKTYTLDLGVATLPWYIAADLWCLIGAVGVIFILLVKP